LDSKEYNKNCRFKVNLFNGKKLEVTGEGSSAKTNNQYNLKNQQLGKLRIFDPN
jgi:hypothetical protein